MERLSTSGISQPDLIRQGDYSIRESNTNTEDRISHGRRLFPNSLNGIDSVTRFYSRFPFAGKLMIRPLTRDVFAEKDSRVKKVKALKASLVLGALVAGHAVQAAMGVNAMEHFQTDQLLNPANDIQALAGSLYFLVNSGAIATQARLVTRVLGNARNGTGSKEDSKFSWAGAIKKGIPISDDQFKYSGTEAASMVGVTLAGQAIFLAFMG